MGIACHAPKSSPLEPPLEMHGEHHLIHGGTALLLPLALPRPPHRPQARRLTRLCALPGRDLQAFRAIGALVCALAIVSAVLTLMQALDHQAVPCPTSKTCDVCANVGNAGNWVRASPALRDPARPHRRP